MQRWVREQRADAAGCSPAHPPHSTQGKDNYGSSYESLREADSGSWRLQRNSEPPRLQEDAVAAVILATSKMDLLVRLQSQCEFVALCGVNSVASA